MKLTREQFESVAVAALDAMHDPLIEVCTFPECRALSAAILNATAATIAGICNENFGTKLSYRDVVNQLTLNGIRGLDLIMGIFIKAIEHNPNNYAPMPNFRPAVARFAEQHALG